MQELSCRLCLGSLWSGEFACVLRRLFRGEVFPEALEAFVAAEERGEDGGVREQDVTGALVGGGHPEEHVEGGVAGFDEGVRVRCVEGLLSQETNGVAVVGRDCVVRQVWMKVEGADTLEPATRVQAVSFD